MDKSIEDDKFKYKVAVLLTGVGGLSLFSGFGYALSAAKKKDLDMFNKGLLPSQTLPEGGAILASRALAWGSLYAITGVSLICFAIWKLSGAKNMQEFRQISGRHLPKVPKNDPPRGRTEFSGLNDLLKYIMDEDNKAKEGKKSDIFDSKR